MRLTRLLGYMALQRIFAAVLSLAFLAICGNAAAGPYDQGAAQFIRLMEKQAAGSLTSAVGVNVARGLGVMNPALALGTTALALYMMACESGQSDSSCLSLGGLKVALKPNNTAEDRPSSQYSAPPTYPTYSPQTVYCVQSLSNTQQLCVLGAYDTGAWGAQYGEAYCQTQGSGYHYTGMTAIQSDNTVWVVCNGTLGLQRAYVSTAPNTCATGDTLSGGVCQKPAVCPAGTALSGSVCVGQILTPDGVNRFKSISAQWSAPFPDVDNPTQPATAPANPLTYTGVDPFGNKQRITLRPRTDGGVDVEIATEYVAGGQSAVQFNEGIVNPDGSINEKVYTKTGTLGDQGAPLSTTAPTPGATPSPVVVNVTVPPLTLPTDYAREATQQANNAKLTSIDTTLKTGVKVDETGTPTGGDFSGADTAADAAKASAQALATTATDGAGKDTTWGFSLNLPSTCTNPAGIVVPNWHLNWIPDLCQFSDRIQAVTGFLWILLTLGSCLSMVRSTVSGGA